jgi:aryl-alcohol dehydrogenase-like predicted oxidoreductase
MGLSEFYGPPMEHRSAINLLHEAVDLGVEHFDTAELYGIGGANETLLGEAFADRRDRVFIATKFGPTRDLQTGAASSDQGSASGWRAHSDDPPAPLARQ